MYKQQQQQQQTHNDEKKEDNVHQHRQQFSSSLLSTPLSGATTATATTAVETSSITTIISNEPTSMVHPLQQQQLPSNDSNNEEIIDLQQQQQQQQQQQDDDDERQRERRRSMMTASILQSALASNVLLRRDNNNNNGGRQQQQQQRQASSSSANTGGAAVAEVVGDQQQQRRQQQQQQQQPYDDDDDDDDDALSCCSCSSVTSEALYNSTSHQAAADDDCAIITAAGGSSAITASGTTGNNNNKTNNYSNNDDDIIPPSSPTLRSLRTKKRSPLPDEQDRKRFVGCLAAVLASAYDYDDRRGGRGRRRGNQEVDDDEILMNAESMAYLSMSEHDDYADDDDYEDEILADGDSSFDYGSTSADTQDAQHQQHHRRSHSNNDQYYHTAASASAMGNSSSFDYASSSSSRQQHRQQGRHRSNTTSSRSQQQQPMNSRNKTMQQKKAQSRHRKRRYDIASKLLLSSSELLQLEKGHARAFLPMLAQLLVPTTNSSRGSSSSKRRQQQHGRYPQQSSSSSSVRQRRDDSGADDGLVLSESVNMIHEEIIQKSVPSAAAAASSSSSRPVVSKGIIKENNNEDYDFLRYQLQRIEHLQPFLDSMTPGSGFRCLAFFLLQHLLTSQDGYDARIRRPLKVLGVMLLVHDMDMDSSDDDGEDFSESSACARIASEEKVRVATRQFESLEHSIAARLMRLSREQKERASAAAAASGTSGRHRRPSNSNALVAKSSGGIPSRDQILRGLKIGGTAVVAGTLFAVTGGLAAPGIAAGVAAVTAGGAIGTAATAAATAVLTSTAAVTAIFGVGGGGLAAYKMNRRTQGLTEFEFNKENHRRKKPGNIFPKNNQEEGVDLFSTIVISGWLRDEHDFQRPWGVTPTNPPISDRLELLERFYAAYRPDHVPKCRKILQSWEGEEEELWNLLRQKYGQDPDDYYLAPLLDDAGPTQFGGELTLEQRETVHQLFIELGYTVDSPDTTEPHQQERQQQEQPTPFERMQWSWNTSNKTSGKGQTTTSSRVTEDCGILQDSLHGPHHNSVIAAQNDNSSVASNKSSGFESVSTGVSSSMLTMDASSRAEVGNTQDGDKNPKHLSTVWDYQAKYGGGELYTVKWESDLLLELCDSVSDLAYDLVTGGTAQILRHTALASLMSAIAWPYALINAANMIDGTWTLAVERSDEAGKELAKSLLFSRAGHRPVTLVGYSFGARTIYSCLKELARYQEKWEDYHEEGSTGSTTKEGREFYKKMREPASIVEDAIIMGLPNHLSLSSWQACRMVVSGRLINCYSQKDLILSLMFQFKRLGLKPVCGTCPVNVNGVENVDVTDIVQGHQDYCLGMGDILNRIHHGQPFTTINNRPTTRTVSAGATSSGPSTSNGRQASEPEEHLM